MTVNHGAVLTAAVLLAALSVSGCGKKETEKQTNPFAGAPFVMVPGPNGNLELRTPDGKPIAPSATAPEVAKGQLDLKAGAVLVLKTLTLQNQCIQWVYFNGRWYQIPC